MYCPPDVNTGFIELVGPIQQPDLTDITVKSYPLSISFAPRTTVPTLIGNRIDESTENTLTYKGKRFSLVDVQICSVTNKGYILPGQTKPPVAELILSFSANNSANDLSELSGTLLCIPIYDFGNPSHSEYLNQLIDPIFPNCKYTTELNSTYSGQPYQTLNNQTLSNCIATACSDQKVLAYTYTNGKCMLYESINPINKSTNGAISGTVNHNVANDVRGALATCDISPNDKKSGEKHSKVPTIETIFYSWNGDTSQSSLAYKTCFETFDRNENVSSKSLYVVVFPNGIRLTPAAFQQLMIQLNGTLPSYMIPPAIRAGEATLRSYRFNNEGNKVPTITSQDGLIYSTPLSSCTDDFKFRFEYFTLPPRLPISKLGVGESDKCPYYKTTEYKCVPFNQLKDLSGAYVIPGNKTLDTVLYEQEQSKLKASQGDIRSSALTTEQMEGIVAGSIGAVIGVVLLIWAGSKISKYA
jgi:hypothetical protein